MFFQIKIVFEFLKKAKLKIAAATEKDKMLKKRLGIAVVTKKNANRKFVILRRIRKH